MTARHEYQDLIDKVWTQASHEVSSSVSYTIRQLTEERDRGGLQLLVDLVAMHNISRPLNRDSIKPGFANLFHDHIEPGRIIRLN